MEDQASRHDGSHTNAASCPLCLRVLLEAAREKIARLETENFRARRELAGLRRQLEKSEDSNRTLRRVRDELRNAT